jgi:hypothetical protein
MPRYVLGVEPTGVEEEPRGKRARDHSDQHGYGDAGAGKEESRNVELHVPSILGSGSGTQVVPKVTRTLDRRRLLVLVAAVLASACAPVAQTGPGSTASPIPPLGANPMRGIWPAQYASAPPQVREAYAWAATHENVLRYIPCYCGCGANGHKNNYDCFVRARGENGWITMDLHGLSCGTCVSITLETAVMTAKGLTVRQMRTAIDARWSSTGPSTPTPLP